MNTQVQVSIAHICRFMAPTRNKKAELY